MKIKLGLILMLVMVFTGCNEPKKSMNNENINSNQMIEEKDDTDIDEVIRDDEVTPDEVVTGKEVVIDEVTTEDDEISNYSNYKYIKDMGELLWKKDYSRDNVDEVLEETLEGVFEKGKPSEQVKLSITYFADDPSNSESIVKLLYDTEIYEIKGYTDILNIYMVDVDVDDDYRELYVDCSGYSADRNGEMFRIIDGEFIHLGSIEKDVQCNQKGNFISENYVIRFIDEPLIGAVYYVEDNTIKMKNLIDEEKELVVNTDEIPVGFMADEGESERDWLVWLKKGDILKIYSIDEEDSEWEVELNGEKGTMCLQVAG